MCHKYTKGTSSEFDHAKSTNPFAVFPSKILEYIFDYIRHQLIRSLASEELLDLLLVDHLFNLQAKRLRQSVAEADAAATTGAICALRAQGKYLPYCRAYFKNPFFDSMACFLLLLEVIAKEDRARLLTQILPTFKYKTSPMRPIFISGKNEVAGSCEYCKICRDGKTEVTILKEPNVTCYGGVEQQKVTWAVKFRESNQLELL
ncbi:hypothetical protein HDV00_001780 [Rhizophlyctis rosea]|nr:hypothetical protein HDV00_001780 [Rhizophlyctis rosea]